MLLPTCTMLRRYEDIGAAMHRCKIQEALWSTVMNKTQLLRSTHLLLLERRTVSQRSLIQVVDGGLHLGTGGLGNTLNVA